MSWEIEFYRTAAGDNPGLDYISAQVKGHRAKIWRAVEYLKQTGHQARRPQVEYLGEGIYELRIKIEKHQHRLLYFFHGELIIVVTSGFLKNRASIPASELERAQRRRADWTVRFGRE